MRDDVDLTDLDRFAEGFPHHVFDALRRESPVWFHPPTAHSPGGFPLLRSAVGESVAVAHTRPRLTGRGARNRNLFCVCETDSVAPAKAAAKQCPRPAPERQLGKTPEAARPRPTPAPSPLGGPGQPQAADWQKAATKAAREPPQSRHSRPQGSP
jgi:hypothetical protein